jgi:hypothetical protein
MYLESIWDGSSVANQGGVTHTFTKGAWHSVQGEIRYGDAATAYQKWWIDTDTYASPSFSLTGHAVTDATNGNNWRIGTFMNHGLGVSSEFTYRHADYRIATTFDSNWHGSI